MTKCLRFILTNSIRIIIRAYARHYVAPIGTQFIGECKSVFICGIPIGGNLRHYVPTRSIGFIPGLSPPLCIDGVIPIYIRRGIRLPLSMATLIRIYIRRGVLKLLCWRSSAEFIYIRHVLIASTQRHIRPLDAIYPYPIRHYPVTSTALTRLSYAAITPLNRTYTNKTATTNEDESKVIAVYGGLMRTKSEISIEDSDSSMLNEKRRLSGVH